MKKNLILSFSLLALVACTKVPTTYEVKGEVADSTLNGQTIYLTVYDDGSVLDSTIIADNKFTFIGKADTAQFCRIELDREYGNIILENGKIEVDMETHNYPKGTPSNEFLGEMAQYEDFIFSLMRNKQDELAAQGLEPKEMMEQMKAFYEPIKQAIELKSDSMFKIHNNDAIGEALLRSNYFPREDFVRGESIINSFGPWLSARKTTQKMLKDILNLKNTAEGKPFTDIKGKNADGEDISLSDYVGKGKYVLVDFWASWCGPCLGELPNLKALNDKYKDKGLQLMGVFVWDNQENLKPTIEKENLTWPQLSEPSGTGTELYGISGIPHIILFAPDGTILKRDLRGQNMIEYISDIMDKK